MGKLFEDIITLNREVDVASCSFGTNGTSAPINLRGSGFTASRIGVGKFQVVFSQTFQMIDCETALQVHTAGSHLDVFLGDVDLSLGNRTAILQIIDSSTGLAADLAAQANNRVSFSLAATTSGFHNKQ